MSEIEKIDPDIVLTSSRAREALVDPGKSSETSRDVMIEGMIEARKKITDSGIGLVTLMDNPSPDGNVYECVAENSTDLEACTFDKAKGEKASGKEVLTASSEAVNGEMIDLNPYICPNEECVPVIGNVLVYRQASHLTDTYIQSLISPLEQEMVSAVETAGRGPR